ncbi:hypothetical protein BpHYR1_026776 [Brachionus plicatilis]|uniref:Uncharacterized protein n=1 Tax=Brachionus plicatilis TaxID=10195 RepID=A0A3M7QA11_BRAPC|nr:hypothetical protein BpHYR1_026776 [Brachionus plicatilis]
MKFNPFLRFSDEYLVLLEFEHNFLEKNEKTYSHPPKSQPSQSHPPQSQSPQPQQQSHNPHSQLSVKNYLGLNPSNKDTMHYSAVLNYLKVSKK